MRVVGRVHVKRTGGGGGDQMCVVGRVHVKRTGGSNACGGEGACEKDGGIKCVWWGGYM